MRFSLRALLLATMFIASTMAAWMAYWNRWGGRVHYSHKILEHIKQLHVKRPSSISVRQWECLVDWTTNLHANSMLPYGASVSEISNFERRLSERLAEPVDHTDIEWIWDEFAAVCPGGQRYQVQRICVNLELKSLGSSVFLEPPNKPYD